MPLIKAVMKANFADLWNLVDPYVTDANLELVELEFGREPEGFVLRLCIDVQRSDGPTDLENSAGVDGTEPRRHVGHEDCERVSRDVSAALDVSQTITHAYRLEVSSPGIERPLRREVDFQRFKGQRAKVRTHNAVDGRRNFSGMLQGANDGILLIDCDGLECRVPIADIAKAHLLPDWAEEFRKSEARSGVKHDRSAS